MLEGNSGSVEPFNATRAAKEFLISRIIAESQREGVPLSEIERKMLYFSETAWTLPDIGAVNDTFDREGNQAEYEQKIGKLIRNLCANARATNREEFDAWTEAVGTIRREDHYLLVLIAASESSTMSARRLLKLLVISLGIACVVMAVIFLAITR